MNIVKTLRTKTGRVATLIAIATALVVSVIEAIVGHAELVPLTILVGLLWAWIQLFIIDIKFTLSKVKRQVSTLSDRVVDSDSVVAINRVETRVRKIAKTTNDIAGTTGRMAPLVRDIASRSVDGSSGPKKSGPKSKTTQPGKSSIVDSLSEFTSIDDLVLEGRRTARQRANVMTIADEFTHVAFSHEWNQFLPTPNNWREVLDESQIDMLFVESAWEANGTSWRYHLVGQSAPRPAVVELVDECRNRGIPTVFWNKEDPPHFHEFKDTAKLFDYVFTTEESLVDAYKEYVGHDNVFVLPFAAQPAVHNPARLGKLKRTGPAVFGGMYFREKYPERRAQMDYLLPAAEKHGLDIYSRNTTDERFQFPEPYDKAIRGSLPYPTMVAAYHAYKVVLNVNSVPISNSMCARRIFEATACGAAVVSPESNAISNFFPGGLITSVNTEREAASGIRALLRSEIYRDRLVHLAQREVWEKHTYSNRVQEIFNQVGLEFQNPSGSTSVIITTNRPYSLEFIRGNISRQSLDGIQLVLASHGFEWSSSQIDEVRQIPNIDNVVYFVAPQENQLGQNLNELVAHSDGSLVFRMDDDDWYGPNYLRDMKNAIQYSGADLVGKAASYIYFENRDQTILTYAGHEHRYTDFIRGATFSGPRDTFLSNPFDEIGRSEDSSMLKRLMGAGGLIYSADRFNFIVNRMADKAKHTWRVEDEDLFATGDMAFVGSGRDQIAL